MIYSRLKIVGGPPMTSRAEEHAAPASLKRCPVNRLKPKTATAWRRCPESTSSEGIMLEQEGVHQLHGIRRKFLERKVRLPRPTLAFLVCFLYTITYL